MAAEKQPAAASMPRSFRIVPPADSSRAPRGASTPRFVNRFLDSNGVILDPDSEAGCACCFCSAYPGVWKLIRDVFATDRCPYFINKGMEPFHGREDHGF